MRAPLAVLAVLALSLAPAAAQQVQYYAVPEGAHPHDVAPAPDGTVWYTAQHQGALGRLDPKTGTTEHIPLGANSSPHGVIVGPDGAAWITDSGLNAIVRVDPASKAVKVFPLPKERGNTNLNTAAFDKGGILWFTGQAGIYGRVEPKSGEVKVWDAPRGNGPYGIAATPDGTVYYVSLAGSYLARIDSATGQVRVIDPPTAKQGARRVWADSKGRLWIAEWFAGQLSMFEPATGRWQTFKPPGNPRVYSVYVDEADKVWITDFAANAILRFDPLTAQFQSFPSDRPGANVRQMLGRKGEPWGAESGTDRLVVVRY